MYAASVVVILASMCPLVLLAEDGLTNRSDNLPAGDPGRCLTGRNRDMLRFEVLPGGGWDNLRNVHAGEVLGKNYSLCRTTEDGRFLLPDGIYTIPIKSSNVETFAELIEHWDNYTSTFSRSINIHAGLSLPHVSISGKFSDEYEHVKSSQYYEKSATVRTQGRYVRYRAMANPDTALSDPIRARLRQIGAHMILNQTDLARYESQLLVRDFGTHVITSVDAGAALVKEDHVSESYVRKYESTKHVITASASASFFSIFSFGAGYQQTATTEQIHDYNISRIRSEIQTHGGPMFRPQNFTADDWIDEADNNLVAIDIAGDPIYYAVTSAVLPDLPEDAVYAVYDVVKDAVEEYYKHNTYRGCLSRDSPNFSFQANVDDGSCKPPNTNFTFGGVYQTCRGTGYTDHCANKRQKNPLTGTYGCPDGYEAVLLDEYSKTTWDNRRECHGWFVFRKCKVVTYTAKAVVDAYWCSAKGPVAKNHGFQFGGLYTSKTTNPMTQSASCPLKYYPLHLLDILVVCVSDDYELGADYSLPFAGFFSCQSGNPLAMKKFENANLLSTGDGQRTLMTYMLESGAAAWPKSCPDGYSQHLAMVNDECEINYCIKSGVLSPQGLPKVQQPPFLPRPHNSFKDLADVAFTTDGSEWISMYNSSQTLTLPDYLIQSGFLSPSTELPPNSAQTGSGNDNPESGSSITGAGIAAISVGATLACVLVSTAIVVFIRRRRCRRRPYRNADPWEHVGEQQPVISGRSSLYSGEDTSQTVVMQQT